jgi:nitrogen fixation protein NifX
MISIAFASSDRDTVNEHFGAASAFAILEIDETSSRLREVAEFIDTAMDGHEGKLDAKIAPRAAQRELQPAILA